MLAPNIFQEILPIGDQGIAVAHAIFESWFRALGWQGPQPDSGLTARSGDSFCCVMLDGLVACSLGQVRSQCVAATHWVRCRGALIDTCVLFTWASSFLGFAHHHCFSCPISLSGSSGGFRSDCNEEWVVMCVSARPKHFSRDPADRRPRPCRGTCYL